MVAKFGFNDDRPAFFGRKVTVEYDSVAKWGTDWEAGLVSVTRADAKKSPMWMSCDLSC